MTEFDKYGPLESFLDSDAFRIPEGGPYFPGCSERCVEIPFVFSRVSASGRVLDVGVSLSDPVYFHGLLELLRRGVELHASDIVPIDRVLNRFSRFDAAQVSRIRFRHDDIRSSTFESDFFDAVLCVSMLEHVGFDVYVQAEDTVFDRPRQDYESFPNFLAWDEDSRALNEMLRILRPGGRLLLTVPYGWGGVYSTKDSKGRYAAHLEYNKAKWDRLKSSIRYATQVRERAFKHFDEAGWREVALDAPFAQRSSGESYSDQGVLCVEIEKRPAASPR
jgi:SAM-dependent methyltransferase